VDPVEFFDGSLCHDLFFRNARMFGLLKSPPAVLFLRPARPEMGLRLKFSYRGSGFFFPLSSQLRVFFRHAAGAVFLELFMTFIYFPKLFPGRTLSFSFLSHSFLNFQGFCLNPPFLLLWTHFDVFEIVISTFLLLASWSLELGAVDIFINTFLLFSFPSCFAGETA